MPPSITVKDIDRIARELEQSMSPMEWIDKNNIDHAAMLAVVAGALLSIKIFVGQGLSNQEAFDSVVMSTFALGWTACEQLARKSDNHD